MKKLITSFLSVALMLSSAPVAAFAVEIDSQAHSEPYWIDTAVPGDEDVFCLAVNGDNTRYLFMKKPEMIQKSLAYDLFIYDTQTSREITLHFADSVEVDALVSKILPSIIENPKSAEAFVEEQGGKEAFALRFMWYKIQSPARVLGDLALLSGGGSGEALIDMKTGAVTPMRGFTAMLTADGRAIVCDQDAISFFDPETREYTGFPTEASDTIPLSAKLLSDESVVCLRRGIPLDAQGAVDGSIAFHASNGSLTETVSIGHFKLATWPNAMLYSEKAGVGIAYNPQYIMSHPIRIFRKGASGANVLLITGENTPHVEEVDPAEAVDEMGKLTVYNAGMPVPMGLSQDENGLLLMDLREGNLLYVDLNTLDTRVLLTADKLAALYDEKTIKEPIGMIVSFSLLGWNGRNLFYGVGLPQRSVLCLPMKLDGGAETKAPW